MATSRAITPRVTRISLALNAGYNPTFPICSTDKETSRMAYTLEKFVADCRAALMKDPGPAGRELARQYTERACSDPDFVAKHLGPDNHDDRKILYEDPDLKFCILAHVYKGHKNSNPHDHGPSWAVYGLSLIHI